MKNLEINYRKYHEIAQSYFTNFDGANFGIDDLMFVAAHCANYHRLTFDPETDLNAYGESRRDVYARQ